MDGPTLLPSRAGAAPRLTAMGGATTMRAQAGLDSGSRPSVRDRDSSDAPPRATRAPWRKDLGSRLRTEAPCAALRPSRRGYLSVLRARLLQRSRRSPRRRAGDMQPLAVPAEARRPGEAPALQGLRPTAERRAPVWRAGLPGHTHRTVLTVPRLLLQPPPG
jgi:hypothetical protein